MSDLVETSSRVDPGRSFSTRERLLQRLQQNPGEYLSGEALAEELKVSRTAIWKAIQALRLQGYRIDSVTNRGYCFSPSSDVLSLDGIRKRLSADRKDLPLILLPEVSSTNAYLRQMAGEGAPHGTIVIAEKQTAGRGRMGRSFYSPSNTGIYLSILLKPDHELPAQSIRITTMAAVAACEAMEQFDGIRAEIKWVNDIYIQNRKVAGILTEGSFNMETGTLDYMIMGIGMNLYPPEGGFPKEIQCSAGSILSTRQSDGKNRLVSQFLLSFFDHYSNRETPDYSDQYRRRSMILGKEIDVLKGDSAFPAVAKAIDDDCRLVVQLENGEIQTLSSGEVRIRPRFTEDTL